MVKRVYKEGLTVREIICDQWSRDLKVEQCIPELAASGHILTPEQWLSEFNVFAEYHERAMSQELLDAEVHVFGPLYLKDPTQTIGT